MSKKSILGAISEVVRGVKGSKERKYETPDPTPMAPPIGYKKQPSMVDHIRQMVRSEQLRAHADSLGMETFEEADDFDVGDDYEPNSPYENDFEPPVRSLQEQALAAQQAPPATVPVNPSPGSPPTPPPPAEPPQAQPAPVRQAPT